MSPTHRVLFIAEQLHLEMKRRQDYVTRSLNVDRDISQIRSQLDSTFLATDSHYIPPPTQGSPSLSRALKNMSLSPVARTSSGSILKPKRP